MEIRPSSNKNVGYPIQAAAERREVNAQAAEQAAAAPKPVRTDAQQADERVPGKEELAEALESINSTLQNRSPVLEFSIDSDSDRSVVKVLDRDTQEVIRQMPSREAIEIAKALDKLSSIMAKATA